MTKAVLDACVLYPAALRDFFMRLAVRLYQPIWTDEIHDEWIRNVLRDRPDLSLLKLSRTRELMDRYGGNCRVVGYESIVPALDLPDPDDRHVLAAAIAADASIIVTFNLTDFPSESLSPHRVSAVHPDAFAVRLFEAGTEIFVESCRLHRLALKNPTKEVDEYLNTLRQCGLNEAVLRLEAHRNDL